MSNEKRAETLLFPADEAPTTPRLQAIDGGQAAKKSKRGFASMDKALVSQIAKKGGQAAHAAGTAHEFSSEEAREAGRKGGKATHAKRRGEQLAKAIGRTIVNLTPGQAPISDDDVASKDKGGCGKGTCSAQ